MRLFGWLKRGTAADRHPGLRAWRQAWDAAAQAPALDTAEVVALRAGLERLGLPEDDLEIEREMLDGLDRKTALASSIVESGLPAIPTGHRIVGAEICHFSAPVSVPDDPAQPTGRLLLTSGRAIFQGGPRGTTIAWHTVNDAAHVDRDLVIVTVSRDSLHRFRCNTFADAMCAAHLARLLSPKSRRAQPGV
ncbi:MAG: hypothetical protein LC753_18820 [Acidobacteria bacterium]|nr:hypothetical protein [Acidobacteriota bacterium]MCA1652219.1 hypothetical protein [Acidobacteriota bacterium]